MQDVSVHGAAPAAQQGRTREQDGGRPGEAEGGLQSMLDQGQEEIESLTEMKIGRASCRERVCQYV